MREAKEILREILLKRDIVSEEDISEYLSDRPKKTYDPFLLLNMEAGVDLLLSEINAGTKICIYGDYDADGVTSVCIMYSVLRHLTDNIMYYIPCRLSRKTLWDPQFFSCCSAIFHQLIGCINIFLHDF